MQEATFCSFKLSKYIGFDQRLNTNKIMKNLFYAVSAMFFCTLHIACSKEDHAYVSTSEVVKKWTVLFSSDMENPVTAGHADSGTLNLILYANNSLAFDLLDSKLASGDALTGAFIRSGNPLDNGPVVLDLKPRISGKYLSGTIANLRQTLIDSLLNDNNDLYFDIKSSQVPNGVARGQLNLTIVASFNVALRGQNEVPAVTTTSAGVAYLRLASNQALYSKVTIANVEPNDVMNAAHIHKGVTGVNGPIIVPLVASPTDFGAIKKFTVDQATYTSLLNDPLYVNAHSVLFTAGKIRGQIR